jgi:hypothetical protein
MTGAIQRAAATIDRRLRTAAGERRRTLARRRPVQAIDLILDELEREHLDDRVLTGPQLASWQWRLPGIVGRPPPGYVGAAKSSLDLHAALLDWQGELYDELFPRRRAVFPDLASADD